jgi:hypothetical protein
MRRSIRSLLFLAVFMMALAGSASAATHGVVLNASKSVAVNFTQCADSSGNPLPCLTVVGTVNNNDGRVYACQVVLSEPNHVVFDTTVSPGQSAQWSVVTAYTGQTYLTFTLYCDGTAVPGQTDRVRVVR